jgi:hypothetical protein
MASIKYNPRSRAALFVVTTLFLLLAAVACGGGDSSDGDAPATSSPGTAGPNQTPLASPIPEPTPQPNRADCAAIKGTSFLSDVERDWFAANCAHLDGPAVGPGPNHAQVSIGDKLVIPSANISADVARSTVSSTGQMPDPTGYFNAVWYDFSNWPGLGGYVNAGNMVLSGHVDCARCINGGSGTAVFWSVRKLKPGDTADYRTADGKTISYVVVESHAVGTDTDFGAIVASSTADMTLITCTGNFSGGEYDKRHIVAFKKV